MATKNSTPAEKPTSSAQKLQALESALAQIDRQFGKGSIMRLGDQEDQKLDVIPTSSLALDIALGVGGLPRGRVIEIYGPESSGKCLTADAIIPTNWGLLTVEEIFEKCGMKASCTSRVTDISEFGLKVLNEVGEMEFVSALTHNNRKPVLKIVSATGKTIKVTKNHPVRVLNENGWVVWRTAESLKEGDTLIGVLGGDENVEDKITEEEALLLGYLVGDGHYSPKGRIMFSQVDEEITQEFDTLMGTLFPEVNGRTHLSRPNDTWYNSVQTRTVLLEKGLVHATAPNKTIPWTVRESGPAVQRAFLSALFECDGTVDEGNVSLSTASEQLAMQVQALLASLGIVSSVVKRKVSTYPDNDYYNVSIGSASSLVFLDEIGFRSQRRALQVENSKLGTRDFYRHIPNLKGLLKDFRDAVGGDREFSKITDGIFRTWGEGYNNLNVSQLTLQRVIEWAEKKNVTDHPLCQHLIALSKRPATYEKIVSITPAGEEPTFDLVVPGTHSFVANGLAVHNTTLSLHAVANVQKAGGIVAFIDAEHALDPIYAKNLGVDIENLLISQPDTGEQALEIADTLIRSGAVDLVVVDSVAALVPRAEIEGEMGDSHMGLQARLMSQALRKITGGLNQTGTTIIFINQLRDKIGVMFGCFQYGSRVTLADGTQEKIGKIVNQKQKVDVLSYDFETGQVVAKPVVGWYDNGNAEEFLQVTVAKPSGNGKAQMGVTRNHMVMTPAGWEEAELLEVGDEVVLSEVAYLSDFQVDFIKGSLMGDGCLSSAKNGLGQKFRLGHSEKQVPYLDWKLSMFANIPGTQYTGRNGSQHWDSRTLTELNSLKKEVYTPEGKNFSEEYLDSLSPLALAVWYMDDGNLSVRSKGLQKRTEGYSGRVSFCVQAMTPDTRVRVQKHLARKYSIDSDLAQKNNGKFVLVFNRDNTDKFLELVSPYLHESMLYKTLPRFANRKVEILPEFAPPRNQLTVGKVIDIHVKPLTRSMRRFDIQVEGSHNYFVDGIMVHNSPETTTGGKALKFYASVRLDIRRIEALKDGVNVIGNRTRVKVVKNKVAPPFRQAEFDIIYGEGISYEGNLIDLGVEYGFVRKSGAWYTYEGDQLGQGKEKARLFLKDNPALAKEIEGKVLEKAGILSSVATIIGEDSEEELLEDE